MTEGRRVDAGTYRPGVTSSAARSMTRFTVRCGTPVASAISRSDPPSSCASSIAALRARSAASGTPYDGRRFYASLLIRRGLLARVVAERLGHKDGGVECCGRTPPVAGRRGSNRAAIDAVLLADDVDPTDGARPAASPLPSEQYVFHGG